MIRLAIVSTHPIQYYAPYFKMLSQQTNLCVKVFYTWSQAKTEEKYDPDFKRMIKWDIPLLEGYDFEFVENVAPDPGSHHFKGIDNPTLNTKITEWNPSLILMIGWGYKSHFSCMRHFKGKVKILFRGDSTLLDEKPGLRKMARRFFLTYVYSYTDYTLYVGTNNKKYFLAHGIKEKQLFYAPHAIDNQRFSNDEFDREALNWRRELGIPENAFVLLFAGKFEPKKDPESLLNVAGKVNSDQFYCVLVGNGPLEKSLKEKAATLKNIIFLDFQNQQKMPVVYRLADAFILPSKGPQETWGLAINEAMASGRAVMASTKVGGAVDLIKQNENGFIFEPGDVIGVARFLTELINNKELSRKMGEESKQLISHFSFEHIVDAISKLAVSINL